jgi:serine protease Do
MAKRIVLLATLLAMVAIGFWAGYGAGTRHIPAHDADGVVQPARYDAGRVSPDERDSVSASITSTRRNAITTAVAQASPAVVGINVTAERTVRDPWGGANDPWFRYFFGDRTYRQEVKSLGSGFVISPDGYVLTNDHVAGNGKEITVTLTSKEKYRAELVGTDLVSDISLLKIDGKNLPYMKLGNSDDVIIGEWVIALGNPFGLFEVNDKPTVTVGVVSATGMNLSAEEGRSYRGMIQTDAAINSGNSGGPLINSVGEVIGINAVIYTPNQGSIGLGFAIPINRVKSIVAELKKTGRIERNFWTGLEVQTVDARVARYFGLEKAEGVIVSDVQRSSPAERAGMKPGDIILEVNGERVVNEEGIRAMVADARAGDVMKLKVLREKKTISFSITLERRPS